MSHARLSPSKAKLWAVCPASVRRQENLPDAPSEYATWGTAAHAVLERAILQQTHPHDVDLGGLAVDRDDDWLGEGFEVLARYGTWDVQEMREVAAAAYDYVQFQGTAYAESKTSLEPLTGRDDCHGTADITLVSGHSLEVVDLKTGRGVVVEPTDPQGWIYAAGKLQEHFPFPDLDMPVTNTIVQPRAEHPDGPIRSLTMTAGDLLDWVHGDLMTAMEATDVPDAPAVPGAHCKKGFCKALGTCPEHAAMVMGELQGHVGGQLTMEQALTQSPDQLTMEQVRWVLDNEALITGFLSSVREYALNQAKSGHRVPGYKLVEGRSQRKWSLDPEVLEGMLSSLSTQTGLNLGPEHYHQVTLVSPAQAERAIKPLVTEEVWHDITQYITKQAGAPTLAPETDRRRPVARPVEEVFQPIGGETPDYLQ